MTDLRTEERVEEGRVRKETPPGTFYRGNVALIQPKWGFHDQTWWYNGGLTSHIGSECSCHQ